MRENYSIPASFKRLTTKGGRLDKVSLSESVRQHILLILVSRWDHLRADPSFGSAFWEHDFDSSSVLESKRHEFEKDIKESILRYETRLDPNDLKIGFKVYGSPLPSNRNKKMLSLKKRIEMRVEGRLAETNKTFKPPPFLLYFSPVAIESKAKR